VHLRVAAACVVVVVTIKISVPAALMYALVCVCVCVCVYVCATADSATVITDRFIKHFPAGTSVKDMEHFSQYMTSKEVFDR
jgi:hypothetical protein